MPELNGAQQKESVREAVGNAIQTLVDVQEDLHSAQWKARQDVGATVERLRQALYRLDAARSWATAMPDDVRVTVWGVGR